MNKFLNVLQKILITLAFVIGAVGIFLIVLVLAKGAKKLHWENYHSETAQKRCRDGCTPSEIKEMKELIKND